ncbi:homocysteine methyltransferase [Ruegeria sp. ANG-R]|uniref:homocysteine S-methyltransferase family protein n=1 Tax=Ruegeria sp. ANG-R TaxID=1577903 RepID=UPI00057E6739|nr:homocysteine S-methyltransferase family protein [Ruegeria sp. ANG-R]KIC42533.1 homocysteine methyltransferase [Ruegeria sp. ANG-R]
MSDFATNPNLPLAGDEYFLSDGGIETTLIFQDGIDLPLFAAFVLLETEHGRRALTSYYERHIAVARAHRLGFILESPTWRSSRDWGQKLGYSPGDLDRINAEAIYLMRTLRNLHADTVAPLVISGCVGPRGDGYVPGELMTATEARDYHAPQIGAMCKAGADMVTAITMNNTSEATGIALAAKAQAAPVVIAFTVETDGALPTGQTLADAIHEVDGATGASPIYYMVNCAHPDHFDHVLRAGGDWMYRIGGVRANASRMSHAELDESEVLDDGNPAELGEDYRRLMGLLPNLRVMGGCCGTDHRHVDAMGRACKHAHPVAAQ